MKLDGGPNPKKKKVVSESKTQKTWDYEKEKHLHYVFKNLKQRQTYKYFSYS